jgi:hypothetical protein
MIIFAEEAAERVEEETRAAAVAEGPSRPAPKPTPAERGAALLGGGIEPRELEPKPTVESLFGPDVTVKSEEAPLSAEQVFGDLPAKPPAEEKREEE